jgi:3-dehydroquinate dehydratase-2
MKIIVLQGPNMNRLGYRKPELYGKKKLVDVQREMDQQAEPLGIRLVHFQSNHEGALIDFLQEHQDDADAIICNSAGLTSNGYGLRDALNETEKDLAMVHLSNIHAREQWRRHDVFAEIANLYLAGFGTRVYATALSVLHQRYLERKQAAK